MSTASSSRLDDLELDPYDRTVPLSEDATRHLSKPDAAQTLHRALANVASLDALLTAAACARAASQSAYAGSATSGNGIRDITGLAESASTAVLGKLPAALPRAPPTPVARVQALARGALSHVATAPGASPASALVSALDVRAFPESPSGVRAGVSISLGALAPSAGAPVGALADVLGAALNEAATRARDDTGESFALRHKVFYGAGARLRDELSLELIASEASLELRAAQHVSNAVLALAARARVAPLALAAVARIVNAPDTAIALADSVIAPPVELSPMVGFRFVGDATIDAGGATSFGTFVRARTAVVVCLVTPPSSSRFEGSAAAAPVSGDFLGRFVVVVTQDVSFDSHAASPNAHIPFGANSRAGASAVHVGAGRIDIAWVSGNDATSAQGALMLFEPRLQSLAVRKPLSDASQKALKLPVDAPPVRAALGAAPALATTGAARAVVALASLRGISRVAVGTTFALASSPAAGALVEALTSVTESSPLAGVDAVFERFTRCRDAGVAELVLAECDKAVGVGRFARGAWREDLHVVDAADSSDAALAAAAATDSADAAPQERPSSASLTLSVSHTAVYAWGSGALGQLGVGSLPASLALPTPLPYAGELGVWRVRSIACGWFHTLALTDAGTVFAWGNGGDGQLGLGDTESAPVPRLVDFFGVAHPLTAVAIAAGSCGTGSHSLVIARGNLSGEMPSDDGTASSEGPAAALEIRASGARVAAPFGRVFSFGCDVGAGGAPGTPVTSPALVRPGPLDNVEFYAAEHGGVKAIAAGGGFSLAVTASGALFSWGAYAHGALGLGAPPVDGVASERSRRRAARRAPVRYAFIPTRVTGGLRVPRSLWVDGGTSTAAAESKDGDFHYASLRGTTLVLAPHLNGSPTIPVRSIAAGESHALAADALGNVWAWGRGDSGALGLGTAQASVATPRRVRLSGGARATRVSAGAAHSFAISTAGQLFSWGGGGRGALLGHADGVMPSGTTGVASTENATAAGGGGGAFALPPALLARLRARRTADATKLDAQSAADAVIDDAVDVDDGTAGAPPAAPAGDEEGDTSSSDDDDAAENGMGGGGADIGAANGGGAFYGRGDGGVGGGHAEAVAARVKASSWIRPWLSPRIVRALDGASPGSYVVDAGGGWGHSWALTADGGLFAWGDNGAGQIGVPPATCGLVEVSPRLIGAAAGAAATVSAFVRGAGEDGADDESTATAPSPVIDAFDVASACLRLAAENVVCVAAGGWHMVAATRGSFTGDALRPLWPLSQDPRVPVRGTDIRLRSGDGIEFRAHRALLAARSPLFAARIATEAYAPPARARRSPAVLLIPDLTGAVLAALLEFIYCDTLRTALQPTAQFTRALGFAAAQYGPPRLFSLCRALLESPVAYWSRTLQREAQSRAPDAPETDGSSLVTPEVATAAQMAAAVELVDPATALRAQLTTLLLSPVPQWADVVFKAAGWRFAAHAVVVRAGSEYFRALLAPALDADLASGSDAATSDPDVDEDISLIEISLPDTAATVARMLYFLYSGALPPLPSSALEANQGGILPGCVFPCARDVAGDGDDDGDSRDDGDDSDGGDNEGTPANDDFHGEDFEDSAGKDDFRAEAAVWGATATSLKEEGGGADADEEKPRAFTSEEDKRTFPGVDAQWTPTAQLLQDIVAADRYGIPAMVSQAASLIQGDGTSAAQILELSDLLPAVPRLRDAALTAARANLSDMLESEALAALRVRAPHLVPVIASAAAAHRDTAFLCALAEDASTVRPLPGQEPPKPDEKTLSAAMGFGDGKKFAWKPLAVLFVACFVFLSIAEFTEANHWIVPVVNSVAVIVMAVLLFYGSATQ